MSREEKQLLLKDLCSRLPYGVILSVDNGKYREDKKIWPGLFNSDNLWDAKPYLRPMSSMTKEERLVYEQRLHDVGRSVDVIDADDVVSHIDWLLSKHFDFRGLIPMGLALEAPEGMYKI